MPESSSPLFTTLTIAILVLDYVARIGLVLHLLLRRRQRGAVTIAWIAVVLSIPLFGFFAFLLVGEPRLGTRRAARHRDIEERIRRDAPPNAPIPALPVEEQSIAALAEGVAGRPPTGGNTIDLFGDTELFANACIEAIDAATEHCHLLFYIWLDDTTGRSVAAAVERAARRGVTCRLLLDDVGSRAFLRSDTCAELRAAGAEVASALPASIVRVVFARIDLRNHRKLVIVDGCVAFTGSQNLADASFAPKARFAPWVDAAVRVTGPAVRDLQRLFVEDWHQDTDESIVDVLEIDPGSAGEGVPVQVIGTGPNSINEALTHLTTAALHAAREEIVLTTPYFVPDLATAAAIRSAARRGVTTHLVVPARNDSPLVAAASRSHYESLIDAGVLIHEFEEGLLHAKTLTIDHTFAMIGSANLDRRSFDLNFEVSLLVFDSDFASQLRYLQTSYLDHAHVVDATRWKQRGVIRRLSENTAGLLGPLL